MHYTLLYEDYTISRKLPISKCHSNAIHNNRYK